MQSTQRIFMLDWIKDRALYHLLGKFGKVMTLLVTTDTKVRLLQTLVRPVVVVRAGWWRDQMKIDWKHLRWKHLRQILWVSWTAKNTNLWVLEQAGVNRILLRNVKSGKLRFFSHIMRGEDKSLEKGIIEGTVPGSRKKRKTKNNVDRHYNVTWLVGLAENIIRKVDNRSAWRMTIRSAAYPQTEDG